MKMHILAGTLLFLLVGCSHSVKYKLTENDRWTGPKIAKTICVPTLTDQTTLVTNNEVRIGDDKWRINFRTGYKGTNVINGVSAMIANHLAYSGLFTKVVQGADANADYVLSGTLSDYSARARVNSKAEGIQFGTAVAFGLVGALVGSASTSGMKTEVQSSVLITNFNLTAKSGDVLWHDSIGIQTNYIAHFAAADPPVVFKHADVTLKDVVTELIYKLGNSPLTNQANAME